MDKLAILGGTPINQDYPAYMAWPVAGPLEREAIMNTLHSGKWGTLGPSSIEFGKKYAEYCQAKHALPVLNGTVSIEMILRGLGIGYGDEVILPPYTFSATAHAIVNAGATPVFADTDPETFTIDPASIEAAITSRTAAIIGVHLGGRPFDFDAVKAIADKHGLPIIEDAAHAHGSEWCGRRCGSLGRAGSFSFQNSKNLNSGEGGAITTNDTALYEKVWSIHHNGRGFGSTGCDYNCLSTDARISEWQAAILLARMQRIDKDIDVRQKNADRLSKALASMPFIKLLKEDSRITRNSLHLFCFRYNAEALDGLSREIFVKAIAAEKVASIASGYCEPIYDMGILYSDDYKKMTGSTFVNPKAHLPGNELIAHKEGCWIYHSSLLGNDADTDKLIEAFGRVAAQAGELKKTFSTEA